jgi:hypothetical protein
MTDDSSQEAPDLGEPTDAAVGEETAVFLMNGGKPEADEAGSDAGEQTLDTPDELGGTGGEQAGGAG